MPKVTKDKEAMQKRGDILLNLRKNRNIKQSTVADILGISQQAYLKYEHGDADPTIDALIKLSKFYNVSIEYLLGIEIAPPPANAMEVLGIEKSVDDDEFIRLYNELPDHAKQIFVDTMARLAQATTSNLKKQSTHPLQPVEPPKALEPSIIQSQTQSSPQPVQPPQIESTQSQWRFTARRTDGRYESRPATPEEVEKLKLLENDPEPEF